MNKTLSFVSLDFNLIKPYSKGMLILVALGIVMGFIFKSTSVLTSYLMISLALVMSYPFSVGDKNGMDTLYGTLSLSRKNVVVGRYLFVLSLECICAIISLIFSWVLSLVIGTEFIIADELFVLCLLSCIFSLVVAIQYPIYFKFGYNKAKTIAYIPSVLLFLLVMQLPTLAELFDFNISFDSIYASIDENPLLKYVAPVVVGLTFLALSCVISNKIYAKRDI